MKKHILKLGVFTTMIVMALFVTACSGGSEETHDHQHGQEQHDHEGHQHEQHQQGQEESSVDKTGKEYTSAYICPMHCEGSGSDKEGKCPVCKMDYVKNDEHKH